MRALFFLAVVSFLLAMVITPFVRNIALKLRLVDTPDHHRKIHEVPIPRLGGVAILVSALAAYWSLSIFRFSATSMVRAGTPFALRLLPAMAVIFAVGLLDDVRQVRPVFKLLAQVAAALMAWGSGIHLRTIGGHELPSVLSIVLTTVWIVACSNAMNLIDGVDGLAAGVGVFAVVTTLVAALLHGNIGLALATVPLAGALLGFLRYNFSPASIFLGDCGSLTLGFLLGCYGIVWTEKSTTILSMIAPLVALFVPLLDVGLAIVRRLVSGMPIFNADRRHIHHRLLSRGLPPRRVVIILYGSCGLASIAGLLLTLPDGSYRGAIVLAVSVAAVLGIRELGYMEFGIVGKALFGGEYRRWFLAQVNLVEFERKLVASNSLDQTWELLRCESAAFGFSGIEMRVDGETWHIRAESCWHIRVDFPGRGYIIFTRDKQANGNGSIVLPFAECIERVLLKKLAELGPQGSELPLYAEAR